MKVILLLFVFLGLVSATNVIARERVLLDEDWKFLKRDIAPDQNEEGWRNFQTPP